MNDGNTTPHHLADLATKAGEICGLATKGVCGLAILSLVVVACARSAPHAADAGTAPSPLEVVLPLAILPDGAAVDLELATTPEETTTGLMFRPSLPRDRGMLLLWSEERYATIWMMNVLVPLDIVFLDDAGEVIEIVADARPCAAEPCPRFTPDEPSRAVLELAAGSVTAHGITIGERIAFERVPGYPVVNEELGIRN
jgi:uncharacterized membrane protein (UPF0127 family)